MHIGKDLMSRHGAHGSVLTEEGRHYLDVYSTIEKETSELAQKRFKELA